MGGDELALAMAVSPFVACIIAMLAFVGSAWAALTVLILLQAWLVVADRVRLDALGTDTTALPSLRGSMVGAAYLIRRGRLLGRSQELPLVWFAAMLLSTIPMFAPAFTSSMPAPDSFAACMAQGTTASTRAARVDPRGEDVDVQVEPRGALNPGDPAGPLREGGLSPARSSGSACTDQPAYEDGRQRSSGCPQDQGH